jgi:hypothetical protein
LGTRLVLHIKSSERVNLLLDGSYFPNKLCLVLYRDDHIKYTQLYRITDGEWYEEIKEDITNLLALGIQIESITRDGHRSVLKAIRSTDKNIVIQRHYPCTANVLDLVKQHAHELCCAGIT